VGSPGGACVCGARRGRPAASRGVRVQRNRVETRYQTSEAAGEAASVISRDRPTGDRRRVASARARAACGGCRVVPPSRKGAECASKCWLYKCGALRAHPWTLQRGRRRQPKRRQIALLPRHVTPSWPPPPPPPRGAKKPVTSAGFGPRWEWRRRSSKFDGFPARSRRRGARRARPPPTCCTAALTMLWRGATGRERVRSRATAAPRAAARTPRPRPPLSRPPHATYASKD
jgi:hypothetical protein